MFQVANRNTRTTCEICTNLTIKTSERRHWRRSGVFIVNFVHISHLVLMFLSLTLRRQMPAGYALILANSSIIKIIRRSFIMINTMMENFTNILPIPRVLPILSSFLWDIGRRSYYSFSLFFAIFKMMKFLAILLHVKVGQRVI